VCNRRQYLEAPGTIFQSLDWGSSCHVTIQFSPFPEAIGQQIWVQYHLVKLEAGVTYTVQVSGLSDSFNPALTVFRSGVVAQSAGSPPPGGIRTVSITPPTEGTYAIEIASGQPNGVGGWLTPSGSYTISVDRGGSLSGSPSTHRWVAIPLPLPPHHLEQVGSRARASRLAPRPCGVCYMRGIPTAPCMSRYRSRWEPVSMSRAPSGAPQCLVWARREPLTSQGGFEAYLLGAFSRNGTTSTDPEPIN